MKPTKSERVELHAFSVDYRDRDGLKPGTPVNRGFWVHGIPRTLITCRMLGHKPVVDGTEGTRPGRPGYRWVCCDRCGLRTWPQGDLDPDHWSVGDRYTGELPGPWQQPVGVIGGHVIVGKGASSGVGISLKVGSGGSEHTLAGHVHLGPLGALYLHTERFGTGLQRRLNPVGYDSRVVELETGDGRLRWRLWAKRDEHHMSTPRWRDGSTVIDPRERLFGPVRYTYEPVGEPVATTVRMAEGDDHEVTLSLRRVRRGRKRGDGKLSWSADWSSEKGIPFRNHSWKGDEVTGSAVEVSDAAVESGRWAEEACAAIAVDVSAMRTRYRWRPPAGEAKRNDPDGVNGHAAKADVR